MKRRIGSFCAFVLILVLVLSLGACGVSEKSERAEALCRQMTDAILAKDAEAAYALLDEEYHDKGAFENGFSYLCEAFEGVSTYELKMTGFKSSIVNGVDYFIAKYNVKTDIEKNLVVEVAMQGEFEGLLRYTVSYSSSGSVSGGLTTMKNANLLQWALLILSALAIAFVVLMVLDCIKRQLNAKALWIIVIALGHLKVYADVLGNELELGWNIGAILPYSRLLLDESGAFDFMAVIPVGAVVYFFLRKWLTDRYQAPSQDSPALSQSPDVEPADEEMTDLDKKDG